MKSVAVQTQDEPAPSQPIMNIPSIPTLEAPDLRSSFIDQITNRGINRDADAYVDRLTFFGQEIINLCVAANLFENHDVTTTGDLQTELAKKWRKIYTGTSTLSQWSALYHNTSEYPIDISSENPTRLGELFAAYVGVIYQQDGMRVVQTWIDALIKHSASEAGLAHVAEAQATPAKRAWTSSDHTSHDDTSPHSYKRPRLKADSPCSPKQRFLLAASHQISPSTIPRSTPAIAKPSSMSQVDLAGGPIPPGHSLISVLHERAAKKGLKPNWSFSQNGTSHAPEWHANLSIPEIGLVTMGIHKTKQGAKEEAAKTALTGPDVRL
ncbi:hypothetical protein FRB98_002970 [Tulasnella sp. 332]|nr:hypothetical protein FRB98_002970 [Tulasnella sp. 332]